RDGGGGRLGRHADTGADGLIAVSSGAGGHAGTISPFALIPLLANKIKLPVLAAGSVTDGRGMAAALSLGAAGVYVGTRFIASREAEVDDNDYLLDWRHGTLGLRYAHQFDMEELHELSAACGFAVLETFYSDGANHRSGLYQVWQPGRPAPHG
ncbi:MAG: nitronate monooxygenase, partial [Anaerolineales bacterium]